MSGWETLKEHSVLIPSGKWTQTEPWRGCPGVPFGSNFTLRKVWREGEVARMVKSLSLHGYLPYFSG